VLWTIVFTPQSAPMSLAEQINRPAAFPQRDAFGMGTVACPDSF